MKLLFLFLFLSINAANVPYVFENGENELKIFIAFHCSACKRTLKALFEYLKTNPKIKVQIYYYARNGAELEKVTALMTLNKFQEWERFIFNYKFQKMIIKKAKLRDDFEVLKMKVLAMQEDFKKYSIAGTPTLIFDKKYIIEGEFYDYAKAHEVLKNASLA